MSFWLTSHSSFYFYLRRQPCTDPPRGNLWEDALRQANRFLLLWSCPAQRCGILVADSPTMIFHVYFFLVFVVKTIVKSSKQKLDMKIDKHNSSRSGGSPWRSLRFLPATALTTCAPLSQGTSGAFLCVTGFLVHFFVLCSFCKAEEFLPLWQLSATTFVFAWILLATLFFYFSS